jgi:SNF2 family DNA or RNA helicase
MKSFITEGSVLAIPPKTEHTVLIPLTDHEKKLYKILFRVSDNTFRQLLSTGTPNCPVALLPSCSLFLLASSPPCPAGLKSQIGTVLKKYMSIIELLMRMRQLCCHPYLAVSSLATKSLDNPILKEFLENPNSDGIYTGQGVGGRAGEQGRG